jgi:predicted nucleic acid-binding protein
MARYVLDTDAVIDLLKDVSSTIEVVENLYRQGDTMCTCAVVIAEVYAGLHAADQLRGQRLLESMRFLSTTPSAARQAGIWRHEFARRGTQLATSDCLIAATANENRATLITGNLRDFPMPEVSIMPLPRRQ